MGKKAEMWRLYREGKAAALAAGSGAKPTAMVVTEVEAMRGRNEPGEVKLSIRTSKSLNGGLSSFASVSFHGELFITTALFADYGKSVARDLAKRATEKAVREFHAKTLESVPAIVADVKAFYAAKTAKKAA